MSDEVDRMARAYRGYEETNAAERWSLLNRGNRAAFDERQRATRRLLAAHGWIPLGPRQVLEVGSGAGHELARLVDLGAEEGSLFGVDLLADRVELAKQTYPRLGFTVTNAERLDVGERSIDLVLAITLFSSIKDAAMSRHVASEIQRVLKPGGALLWYDFRYDNPRNPNVHGMSAGAVRELFPSLTGELTPITLLPPLSRRLGPLTPILYPALSVARGLRTHLIGLLTKPA